MDIIRENVKCNVSFIFFTVSMPDTAAIQKALTERLANGYNAMCLSNKPSFKWQSACACKVSFTVYNQCNVTVSDIEKSVKALIKDVHPQIRKYDAVNVEPWSNEEIMRMAAPRICKECGAEMVIRSGQRGQFYGCGSFPKCRYTENI